jgi:hypothetical protein
MKQIISFVLTLAVLSIGPSFHLHAESIALKSGEVLDGDIKELPSKITLKLKDGSTKTISLKDIAQIHIEPLPTFSKLSPKQVQTTITDEKLKEVISEFEPKDPFETPTQTFLTWKAYAEEGDIKGMIDCYASFRQEAVSKELKSIKSKERKAMQASMMVTEFVAGTPIYQGKQAFLEVNWSKGMNSQTQVLKFLLEGTQWKIIE